MSSKHRANNSDANSLLARKSYDQDAQMIEAVAPDLREVDGPEKHRGGQSDSEEELSEEEDEDDEWRRQARTSKGWPRKRDYSVLEEEEEMERLVSQARSARLRQPAQTRGGPFSRLKSLIFPSSNDTDAHSVEMDSLGGEPGAPSSKPPTRRELRRQRRRLQRERLRERAEHGEDGQLIYEMETGDLRDDSATGTSSDSETSTTALPNPFHSAQKARKRMCWTLTHSILVVVLLMGVLVGWWVHVVRPSRQTVSAPGGSSWMRGRRFDNGSSIFGPTTLIFSIDGFRADFLDRGLTPNLLKLRESGLSSPYMLPSFPSVTFPNHFTLATGLYPEAHGIVSNTFWDPTLEEEFSMGNPDAPNPKWWTGEPFWITAEKQSTRTAVHMWPTSEEVDPNRIAFLDGWDPSVSLREKSDRFFALLDRPGLEGEADTEPRRPEDERPQLFAFYTHVLDAAGHTFGPNSTEIMDTLVEVDNMFGDILRGIEERNLTDILNVMVVSDHGMASTDPQRVLQLEDYVDLDQVEHIHGWPLVSLRPKHDDDLQVMYDGVLAAQKELGTIDFFDVYLRDKNMPERYHFRHNERIAPLWIVPRAGWVVVPRTEFIVAEAREAGAVYHPRGLHGYDSEDPLMRAIFMARGPAFGGREGKNETIAPFRNTNIYNMVCDSLGIAPAPNNGTLRLPLVIDGRRPSLHDGANQGDDSTDSDSDSEDSDSEDSDNSGTDNEDGEKDDDDDNAGDDDQESDSDGSDREEEEEETGPSSKLHHLWDWINQKIHEAVDKIRPSKNDGDD